MHLCYSAAVVLFREHARASVFVCIVDGPEPHMPWDPWKQGLCLEKRPFARPVAYIDAFGKR